MVLIAHLADTHLGYAQYRLAEREEDIYELFTTAFEKAINERVNAIVISGDVFHIPRPPNKAILTLYKSIKKAGEKNIKTIVVAGEHDQLKRKGDVHPLLMLSQLSSDLVFIGGFDHSSVTSSKYTIDVDGKKVSFYGVNALPRLTDRVERYKTLFRQLESSIKRENGKKILVAHMPIEGLMSNNIEPSVPIADLPTGFDYFALGHLHMRYIYKSANKGIIGYPGSIDILSRQEIEEWMKNKKGFFIVDLSKEEIDVLKINLDVRPQFFIEDEKNLVLGKIASLLQSPHTKKPIIHIKVKLQKHEEHDFRLRLEQLLRKNVLDYRLEIYRDDPKLGIAHVPGERWSEIDVISRVYGIDKEVALVIVKLKDCLSSHSQPDECENEINEVFSLKDKILMIKE